MSSGTRGTVRVEPITGMDGAGRTTDSVAGGAGIGRAIPPACDADTAPAAAAVGTAITTVASVASGSVAGSASAPSGGASGVFVVGLRIERRRRGSRALQPAPPPARSPSSSDPSYSATLANTGSPADAASARVAPSGATIERRFSWISASRARSRKLIRDVATFEPYGRTSTTRLPSARRMRAAADVISSSTST